MARRVATSHKKARHDIAQTREPFDTLEFSKHCQYRALRLADGLRLIRSGEKENRVSAYLAGMAEKIIRN